MNVTILPATLEHVRAIAPRLRHERILSEAGISPLQSATYSFNASLHCWTGFADDEPACMFGVVLPTFAEPAGFPWLLATDLILAHRVAFLRRSRAVVAEMLALVPELRGLVDERFCASQRWLRWLGFEIGERVPAHRGTALMISARG